MSHPVPLSRSYIIVSRVLSFSVASFSTSSFDMCSVQLISILRHIHISRGFQSCDALLSQSPCFCKVQCHTPNQCFHHSFLATSSFFSILPLVILSFWNRLLSHCYPGASILVEWRGVATLQILGRGSWGVSGRVAEGVVGVVDGS